MAGPPPVPIEKWYFRGRHHIAAFFGVSPTTIDGWMKLPGFPAKSGGLYDASEVSNFAIHRYYTRRGARSVADASGPSSKRRLEAAKAERAELELAQLKGELLEREDVERDYRRYFTSSKIVFSSAVDAILSVVPPELRAPLRPVVQTKIDEACRILEKIPEEWPEETAAVARKNGEASSD